MICLSYVCAESEDKPIDSQWFEKCKGVFHHLPPNKVSALYLQRDVTHSTVYWNQACMTYMDQSTPMDGYE